MAHIQSVVETPNAVRVAPPDLMQELASVSIAILDKRINAEESAKKKTKKAAKGKKAARVAVEDGK